MENTVEKIEAFRKMYIQTNGIAKECEVLIFEFLPIKKDDIFVSGKTIYNYNTQELTVFRMLDKIKNKEKISMRDYEKIRENSIKGMKKRGFEVELIQEPCI